MPSIIQGYEYDIFISYRQKDNQSDQWVTEFINHFKDELKATFKANFNYKTRSMALNLFFNILAAWVYPPSDPSTK